MPEGQAQSPNRIMWGNGLNVHFIAALRLCLTDCSRWQFQNRMRAKACGKAPGADAVPDFPHLMLTIQVDEIYRESHKKRMHRFTGYDPQSFAGQKTLAPQQSFIARLSRARKFKLRREHRAPCHIYRLTWPRRCRRRLRREELLHVLRDPQQWIHALVSAS